MSEPATTPAVAPMTLPIWSDFGSLPAITFLPAPPPRGRERKQECPQSKCGASGDQASIHVGARGLHDGGPFWNLARDIGGEFLRRAARDLDAEIGERAAGVGVLQRLDGGGVQ